jgi:hypothetical protein
MDMLFVSCRNKLTELLLPRCQAGPLFTGDILPRNDDQNQRQARQQGHAPSERVTAEQARKDGADGSHWDTYGCDSAVAMRYYRAWQRFQQC